jgi:hypothetical protein
MPFHEIRGNHAIRVEQQEDVGVGPSCTQIAGPTGSESIVRLKVVVDVEPVDRLDDATNVFL